MPEDYTVTQVKARGPKDNPHGGQLYRFYCSFRDEAGGVVDDCYWQRKSADLEVGEVVYGHIEDGEYGKRFKTDQRPDGGNFQTPPNLRVHSGPPGQASTSVDPQAERSRRIERQSARRDAISYAAIVAEFENGAPSLERIRAWTDELDDLDADVGSSQAAHGASEPRPPVDEDAADLSVESSGVTSPADESPRAGSGVRRDGASGDAVPSRAPEEASRSQKGKLTQMFHAAGLSRDAMKAVVLFRCGSEKATKQGASQLITDLQEGATHDALLAEIWDAKRAGNPLGARAAALIPTEVPMDTEGLPGDDGSLPEVPKKDESDVPF